MIVARRFNISGRVQGVGYRYFAIQAADACGAVGTVRNMADGSVEVVAEGTEEALRVLRSELERGPSFARVTRIAETELAPTGKYKKFDLSF